MRKLEYLENKNICHRQIRHARLALGLSQTELAAKMQEKKVCLDQQMISRVENNRRIVTDFELLCFCDVLGLDLFELLRQCRAQSGPQEGAASHAGCEKKIDTGLPSGLSYR